MLDAGQKQTLFFSLVPYLCLAAYDSFLHERARRVPLAEQAFHGVLFISLACLSAGLFFDRPRFALLALIAFVFAALGDEIGFHRPLPRRERWLHFAAYGCFAGFVVVAIKMGALT